MVLAGLVSTPLCLDSIEAVALCHETLADTTGRIKERFLVFEELELVACQIAGRLVVSG